MTKLITFIVFVRFYSIEDLFRSRDLLIFSIIVLSFHTFVVISAIHFSFTFLFVYEPSAFSVVFSVHFSVTVVFLSDPFSLSTVLIIRDFHFSSRGFIFNYFSLSADFLIGHFRSLGIHFASCSSNFRFLWFSVVSWRILTKSCRNFLEELLHQQRLNFPNPNMWRVQVRTVYLLKKHKVHFHRFSPFTLEGPGSCFSSTTTSRWYDLSSNTDNSPKANDKRSMSGEDFSYIES